MLNWPVTISCMTAENKISGSETKDFITHGTEVIMNTKHISLVPKTYMCDIIWPG